MPSSPMAQAWRNIASPAAAAMCSEKRNAGVAFLSAFPGALRFERGTAAPAIRRRVEQEDYSPSHEPDSDDPNKLNSC